MTETIEHTKTETIEGSDMQIQNWVDDGEVTHEGTPSRLAIEEAGGERKAGEGWKGSDDRLYTEADLEYIGNNQIEVEFRKTEEYEAPDSGDRVRTGDPEHDDDDDSADDDEFTTLPIDDSFGIGDAAEEAYQEGQEQAQSDDPETPEEIEEAQSTVGTLPGFNVPDLSPTEDEGGNGPDIDEETLLLGAAAVVVVLILIAVVS